MFWRSFSTKVKDKLDTFSWTKEDMVRGEGDWFWNLVGEDTMSTETFLYRNTVHTEFVVGLECERALHVKYDDDEVSGIIWERKIISKKNIEKFNEKNEATKYIILANHRIRLT